MVPNSKNKLKACSKCHLLKSEEQWKDKYCENCGNVEHNPPTDKYNHVVSVIDVASSWLRRKIRLPYGRNTSVMQTALPQAPTPSSSLDCSNLPDCYNLTHSAILI